MDKIIVAAPEGGTELLPDLPLEPGVGQAADGLNDGPAPAFAHAQNLGKLPGRGGDGLGVRHGNDGDDYVEAGAGDDQIFGDLGSDLLVQIVDADQTLTNATVSGQGLDTFSDIERIHLYGGASNNVFDVSQATFGVAFLFGAGGTDRVLATGDVDYVLSDWSLRKSLGLSLIHISEPTRPY